MTTLYLTEPGTSVQKTGERLIIRREGRVISDIPMRTVTQVAVVGRGIEVTTEALLALVEHGIDVCFFSRSLRLRARVGGDVSLFGQLRLMQMRLADDPARTLALARTIVRGKLTNQRHLLIAHSAPASGIDRVLAVLPSVADLDVLRGHEGQGAAVYFGGLRQVLQGAAAWGFTHRAYFPPPDPINALLSYGYSLLTREVLASIYRVGFDPFIGVFHALHYGRPSLALDLVEEFRPIIVDRLVLHLVNGTIIAPADFTIAAAETEAGDTPKTRVLLAPEARARYIAAYERRLAERVAYGTDAKQFSYRQVVELQVRALARFVLGEADRYVPYEG